MSLKFVAFALVAFQASQALQTTRIETVHVPADCQERSAKHDTVTWHYVGRFTTGEQFDAGDFTAKLGAREVIAGVDAGMTGMCVGEKRLLTVPSHEAYGTKGSPSGKIPADTTIIFDVELITIEKGEEELTTTKIEVVYLPDECDMKSQEGDQIYWNYDGKLTDGTRFDKGKYNTQLGAGMVIKGVDIGMRDMCVGEKRIITMPHWLGYGERGYPDSIPPYATLVFDVELYFLERPKAEL